ncbi:hypothetical protein Glove_767g6 [Diversispora epigaea]|uniref:Uncharacterized protein n=1 Tax=Diversispora epigaea TaxID=1348612 RepID=A0A397FZ61_9GLOM|nr:hypothetical protein Glove_767g6 [Diversispora epigaea]
MYHKKCEENFRSNADDVERLGPLMQFDYVGRKHPRMKGGRYSTTGSSPRTWSDLRPNVDKSSRTEPHRLESTSQTKLDRTVQVDGTDGLMEKLMTLINGDAKVNCRLVPGFLGPSMCTDKILKKVRGKITRRITPEDKNSKFFRQMTTNPLEWAIIPHTSNIKNNARLSITIPTEVLVKKYNSALPNYILLGNDWFYGRKYDNDELQTYLPEIVTDAKDGWKEQLCVSRILKPKRSQGSDTSDSSASNASLSSSGSEDVHVYKTTAIKKRPK